MKDKQTKTIPEMADPCHNEDRNHYMVPAVCGFLLLAVVLVFGQTVRHGFICFDDDIYIYENPQVSNGLTFKGIAWAFTAVYSYNWHPLTWLSHMLDCQVYGLAPWGHHLTNVLLHAAAAILLFLVLHGMTGDFWPSAFVAAVFAIHPLHVESVAWAAERKDVLSGFFFMLILWAYLGYVRHPFSLARYLAVLALFALGLMAKPMLVTLPFILLLLDYWPLGRMGITSFMRLAREKGPLLILAVASCAVTIRAQGEAIVAYEHIPLSLRIDNAVVSYVAYIGKFFYPAGLAVLYPHPMTSPPAWEITGALLLIAAVCLVVVVYRRRRPYLLVGWFWYMGMLLPVIGLVQVGSQAMADRYTYLTQIGLCIALAWGVANLCQFWPYCRWLCGVASTLVLVVLIVCAWHQTSFWRNSETLWTHTLACTSQNYIAHNNLANMLSDTGRLQEAFEHYEQALRIKPDYAEAHNNLGGFLNKLDRPIEAIEHYRQALLLKPDYPAAYNNLGVALVQTGKPQEAIECYKEALRFNPNSIEILLNLGAELSKTGLFKEAIEKYEQVLRLNPDSADAHINLGVVLVQIGRPQEAIEHYKKAILLRPDYPVVYFNLSLAYARLHQSSEAISEARKALELARSQGQMPLAKEIENWMNFCRTSLSNSPDTPTTSKPESPPP